MAISTYLFDRDMKVIAGGPVTPAEGVRLVIEAAHKAEVRSDSVEEEIARTLVGFENDAGSRLEVSALPGHKLYASFTGSDLIEPSMLGFLRKRFEYEVQLGSPTEVLPLLETFSNAADEGMKKYLETTYGRESWWVRLRRG